MKCTDKLTMESGLVVGWFDVVKTLMFGAFLFAFCGPLPDAFYSFAHTAQAGMFTARDLEFCDSLYFCWKYILPVIAFAVFLYIMNYANTKREM